MANTFFIKRNDTSPAFRRTLKDAAGTVINVTGATILFKATTMDDVIKINAAADIIDGAGGVVEYVWVTGDTDTAKKYKVEWEVTFSGGAIESFPNDEQDFLQITRDLPETSGLVSALILENGAGVRNANSYVTAAFVDTYLADRGREEENLWSDFTAVAKGQFCVAATDYVETRYSELFVGVRKFSFDMLSAEGSLVFTGLPVAAETFLLGDVTYTFVSSLTGVKNEILIGADSIATALNTHDALTADTNFEGITFGDDTVINRYVEAVYDDASAIALTSEATGEGGNDTIFSGTVTNLTITAFTGGEDGGSQPLSFPRLHLFDKTGNAVQGIPRKLKEAASEYAVRAAAAILLPDPSTDDFGGTIKQKTEKVGPIEETTVWDPGSMGSRLLKPYPAADKLLQSYILAGGRVTR